MVMAMVGAVPELLTSKSVTLVLAVVLVAVNVAPDVVAVKPEKVPDQVP